MRRLAVWTIAALATSCMLAASAGAQAPPAGGMLGRHPADAHDGRVTDAAPEPPPDRPPPGPRRDGGPPPVEVLGEQAARLGLDEKTLDSVRAIIKDSRAEADRLHEQVGDAREAMRGLLGRPDADEATVMHQADTIGALEVEEHKNWLRAMLRIRALLTPEQRAELVTLREELFAQVFAGSRAACSSDINRLCPNRNGDEQTRACMRRHRDDVSDICRDAISAEFAKRRKPF